MWRYLKEAFWTRVTFPALGPLPVNALAVLGFGVFGCVEHPIWLLGLGLETAYLYALATNPRFQKVIAARDLWQTQQSSTGSRQKFLAQLGPEARARAERLEGKIRRVAASPQEETSADLLAGSNLDALEKLGGLHLRLLVAEHELQSVQQQSDEAGLARKAATLEKELQAGDRVLSAALRESKQATLGLMQKRLANAGRRTESLAEVSSDLARIEAQVELAAEEASLEGKSAVVADHLNLLNRILESNRALTSNAPFVGSAVGSTDDETRTRELEN